MAKEKIIGQVVHYFDQIKVAVVKVTASSLSVGDTVTFSKGDHSFSQTIESMQVDHKPVDKIKKGQEAGVIVDEPVKEGYQITTI